jgi:hypothetical protein
MGFLCHGLVADVTTKRNVGEPATWRIGAVADRLRKRADSPHRPAERRSCRNGSVVSPMPRPEGRATMSAMRRLVRFAAGVGAWLEEQLWPMRDRVDITPARMTVFTTDGEQSLVKRKRRA